MWLITTRGMVSAVEWRGGEHDGKLVVRARTREHLVAVLELCPESERTAVAVSPSADYRYRAWVTRSGFDALVVALAREITYRNFKDAVAGTPGSSRYSAALHSVWSILERLQPRGAYGTGGSGYPPVPKGERGRPRLSPPKPKRAGGLACVECGHAGPRAEFDVLAGEAYCLDVQGCLVRARP